LVALLIGVSGARPEALGAVTGLAVVFELSAGSGRLFHGLGPDWDEQGFWPLSVAEARAGDRRLRHFCT
jgi:hypothetical protein